MKKHVIKHKEFKKYISTICLNIINSGYKPDYIVGLTRGGLYPAVLMSHYLNVPMHTLNVSLRGNNELEPESNLWMAEDAFGYVSETYDGDSPKSTVGKNILIVDDINDTGDTINWIIEDWTSGCLPNDPKWKNVWNNNVKFAVIVDNLASKCKVSMDFCGYEINKAEEDIWIEFPWEDWWK
jgi:uncharacterized protein